LSDVHGGLTIGIDYINLGSLGEQELNNQDVTVLSSDMKWSVLKLLRLLIDGLAFTNQDSYEVKVAVFTSPPNFYNSNNLKPNLRANAFLTLSSFAMCIGSLSYELFISFSTSLSASHFTSLLTTLA